MNVAAALLTFSLALTDAHQSVRLGPREMNPIVRPLTNHPSALYAVKIGSAAFVTWNVARLKKQGHPRWAFTLWLSVNVAQGYVVIHNARVK